MVVWFANAMDADVHFRVRDDLRWHAVHSAMAGLVCSSLGTENGRNVAASPALRPLPDCWNCMQLFYMLYMTLYNVGHYFIQILVNTTIVWVYSKLCLHFENGTTFQ